MSQTTISDMLKPCPFCASKLVLKGSKSAAYFECTNQDECGLTTNLVAEIPRMIELANTRATNI